MKKMNIVCLSVALSLLVMSSAWADQVITHTGVKVVGIVQDDPGNPGSVVVITHTGRKTIPRSAIKEIIKQDAGDTYLAIATDHLKRGRLEEALKAFEQARQAGADAVTVEKQIAEVRARMEGQAKAEQEQAVADIDQMLEEAHALTRDAKFVEAADQYKRIGSMEMTNRQQTLLQERLKSFYYQWGMNSLDHIDRVNAAKHFEKALELDPNNDAVRRQLIQSWEKDRVNLDQVAAYYQSQADANPDDMALRAQAGNAFYEADDFRKALLHFVAVYDAKEKDPYGVSARLENAFLRTQQQAAEEGDYPAALNIYNQYLERFPEGDREPAIGYEYILKRQAIIADTQITTNTASDPMRTEEDILAENTKLLEDRYTRLAELALWCRSEGLDAIAEKELGFVLSKDPDNKVATQAVLAVAQAKLQNVKTAFNSQNFVVALNGAEDLLAKYRNIGVIAEEADALIGKARTELAKQINENRQAARQLADTGTADYNQALLHISSYRSSFTREDIGSFNDYQEAKILLNRAIQSWRSALQMDPSLDIAMNLSAKISDARRQIDSLKPRDRYKRYVGTTRSNQKRADERREQAEWSKYYNQVIYENMIRAQFGNN